MSEKLELYQRSWVASTWSCFCHFDCSSIEMSAWSLPGIQRDCGYIGSKMPAELHFVLRAIVTCFQITQWITSINTLNLHVVIWNRCLLNSTGGVFIILIFLRWAPLGKQCLSIHYKMKLSETSGGDYLKLISSLLMKLPPLSSTSPLIQSKVS